MQKISAGKFHLEPPSRFTSLDHLVGAGEQAGRYFEAERTGRGQVDNQLELGQLHDRQVFDLGSLKEATRIGADLTISVSNIGSIAHQSASLRKLAHVIDGGNRMSRR